MPLTVAGGGKPPLEYRPHIKHQIRRQQHSYPSSTGDINLIGNMAIFNFYFASCVLLLTLNWRTSTGLPVRTSGAEKCKENSLLFRELLLNVTELLKSEVLCYGIPFDNAVVNIREETVLACAPNQIQDSACMMQRNSPFNESDCLRNIMKDLAHYAAAFQSYLESPLTRHDQEVALLSPTLGIIERLRKNCSLMPNGESDSSEESTAEMWGVDSFSNRQKMCDMMRGFYARTITINRALGYISSGHHMK